MFHKEAENKTGYAMQYIHQLPTTYLFLFTYTYLPK